MLGTLNLDVSSLSEISAFSPKRRRRFALPAHSIPAHRAKLHGAIWLTTGISRFRRSTINR
jgi:hypothetical protein